MKQLFFLSFLLGFSICNAQTQFGIKAGANASSLTGKNAIASIENKIGFYEGGTINFTINKKL